MAAIEQSSQLSNGQVPTAWESFKKGVRSSGMPWLFIAPAIIIMLMITFYPQIRQIFISFTDFAAQNLGGTPANYLGLDNFRRVLTNQINVVNYDFFPLLGFNIVWTVINVAFHAGIGLAVALALNAEHVIGRRFYRAVFVLPWALPGYITALIWNNLWQQNSGGINLLFQSINENLGTQLPTRTAWLTDLNAPISILGIVPYLIIVVCAGLALWLVFRTVRSGGLTLKEEVDRRTAPPLFVLSDFIGLLAALLLVIGFFFVAWVTAGDVSASGFNMVVCRRQMWQPTRMN